MTNLRFAYDRDGLIGKEEELVSLVKNRNRKPILDIVWRLMPKETHDQR